MLRLRGPVKANAAIKQKWARLLEGVRLSTEMIAPEEERGSLVNSFVVALRHRRNFDPDPHPARSGISWPHSPPLPRRDRFRPWRGSVIRSCSSLPKSRREHLFLHPGAILDAAEDSTAQSVKLALYQDPPVVWAPPDLELARPLCSCPPSKDSRRARREHEARPCKAGSRPRRPRH